MFWTILSRAVGQMFSSIMLASIVALIVGCWAFIISLFIDIDTSFWVVLAFFIAFGVILVIVLIPNGKCPKCKKSYYDEDCQKGSKDLSRKVLPNTFTDDKGKIKTEYIATGKRTYFYKCPKCGYEWDETLRYKEKTKI